MPKTFPFQDSIGQKLVPGAVCVHVSRQSSFMYFEVLVVDELIVDANGWGRQQDYAKGTKVIRNWQGTAWEIKKSHPIMTDRLIVTGMTMAELSEFTGGAYKATRELSGV